MCLQVSDKQHPELQQLRQHIKQCFGDIRAFLMPHPGLKVATDVRFRGNLDRSFAPSPLALICRLTNCHPAEIEPEFKEQLRSLVPKMLHPKNLEMKRINGQPVTCLQLLQYFKVACMATCAGLTINMLQAYTAIFQGEELPEPKSMLMATAEANNLAAVASAKEHYRVEMEKVCSPAAGRWSFKLNVYAPAGVRRQHGLYAAAGAAGHAPAAARRRPLRIQELDFFSHFFDF